MDDDELQQFSLRWHNHQANVIGALERMLATGALTDVILSASGVSMKAHRNVLASCSQYFAQLFKEMEADTSLVVVLNCEAVELKLLLTFMYTGEVTASKKILPSLLRLAQSLKVSGLTDADTSSTFSPPEADISVENDSDNNSPINLERKSETPNDSLEASNSKTYEDHTPTETKRSHPGFNEFLTSNERDDRLSRLDQIVQNLYSTHNIGNPIVPAVTSPVLSNDGEATEPLDRRPRPSGSVCTICNKRLSNQYNLRVHMETHAGRRHACRACHHVSRSRDALRKHVAYRHATNRPGDITM